MSLPLRYILTVSELTQQIRDILEERFSEIWVEGEISNFRLPPSQHMYFTLKDDFSQIRAVLFKTQARALRFLPKDGLHVICRGRVGLYERRGDYQLILESLEPKGVGALQMAFLQLKEKLQKEGLFDSSRKKPIPMLPRRIGIITSPTGAAIRDMLQILERRFENLHIVLYPVRVQGEGACSEIVRAIRHFNKWREVDVIIVGRGGGSIEDLWAFNEERVARAIGQSRIPIISAVGHETDYTIADFVADLRAPTPSAAAELVIKERAEIENTLRYLEGRLQSLTAQTLQDYRTHLSHMAKIFRQPGKQVEQYCFRIDDLINRLHRFALWTLKRKREQYLHVNESLLLRSPFENLKHLRAFILETQRRLLQSARFSIDAWRQRVSALLGKLDSLSPLSILKRGYSITRTVPSLQIIREAKRVSVGDKVEVTLYQGSLLCGVEKRREP